VPVVKLKGTFAPVYAGFGQWPADGHYVKAQRGVAQFFLLPKQSAGCAGNAATLFMRHGTYCSAITAGASVSDFNNYQTLLLEHYQVKLACRTPEIAANVPQSLPLQPVLRITLSLLARQ